MAHLHMSPKGHWMKAALALLQVPSSPLGTHTTPKHNTTDEKKEKRSRKTNFSLSVVKVVLRVSFLLLRGLGCLAPV